MIESTSTTPDSTVDDRRVRSSVGDSYDKAFAETVNGLYKTELIRGPSRTGPWKTVEDVELATLSWVHWHNHERLHGHCGDMPPAEFEAAFYAADQSDPHRGSETNSPSLHQTQGGSLESARHASNIAIHAGRLVKKRRAAAQFGDLLGGSLGSWLHAVVSKVRLE